MTIIATKGVEKMTNHDLLQHLIIMSYKFTTLEEMEDYLHKLLEEENKQYVIRLNIDNNYDKRGGLEVKHYKAELYRKFLEGRLTESHIHELFRKLDEQAEKVERFENALDTVKFDYKKVKSKWFGNGKDLTEEEITELFATIEILTKKNEKLEEELQLYKSHYTRPKTAF